jgi:hypothetical protein
MPGKSSGIIIFKNACHGVFGELRVFNSHYCAMNIGVEFISDFTEGFNLKVFENFT